MYIPPPKSPPRAFSHEVCTGKKPSRADFMYMSGMCSGVGNFRPMHEKRAAREDRPNL